MSLVLTNLLDAIERVGNTGVKSWQQKHQQYGAYRAFKANSEDCFPVTILEQARRGAYQALKIPYLGYKRYTVGNTLECTPTGEQQTSALLDIDFQRYVVPVTLFPEINAANFIDYTEELMKAMQDAIWSIYDQLEADAVAALEASKSAVNNTTFTYGGFSVASGVFRSTLANWQPAGIPMANSKFWATIPSMMAENEQFRNLELVMNYGAAPAQEFLSQQGDANSINARYLFNNMALYKSAAITNGVGVGATMYGFERGQIGTLTYLPLKFRDLALGRINESEFTYSFNDATMGGFGNQVGIQVNIDCDDQSAVQAGLTATKRISMQLMMDVAFVVAPPISTNTPIKKIEALTS